MGFLIFAVKCLDVLAWPLFALGYPLFASIRAIETNSNSDMQKLITYWIIFSLISLFEIGLVKLIEWLPYWPYLKLVATCWLVIPHFDGAYYIYELLVRPCFSVNPQDVINKLNRPKEELCLNKEDFLTVAERYLKENGSEALEKLMANKSKGEKPNNDVEVIKAVANTQKKVEVSAIQMDCRDSHAVGKGLKCEDLNVTQEHVEAVEPSEKNAAAAPNQTHAVGKGLKCEDPNVTQEHVKAVEPSEKNAAAAANQTHAVGKGLKCEAPNVTQEHVKAVEPSEKNAAAAPNQVEHAGPNLHQAGNPTAAAAEVKEMRAESAYSRENKPPETSSQNVQKEWACAICQVRTTSEYVLNSHLKGKKHRAKCEELKASKKTEKSNVPNQNETKRKKEKVQWTGTSDQGKWKYGMKTNAGMNQSKLWCGICNIGCPGEIDLASHLGGRKHLLKIQELFDSLSSGPS